MNLTKKKFAFLFFILIQPNLIANISSDSLLYFPVSLLAQPPDTNLSDNKFLTQIAEDTWKFFENSVYVESGLIPDNIKIAKRQIADYTSITNIGFYILSVICAKELGFINDEQAIFRIQKTISTVKSLPTYNGFYFNWYDIRSRTNSNYFISSIDAAWFYSSLAVLSLTYPDEFGRECDTLIKLADFAWLYNDSLKHFRLGYDAKQNTFSPYHYELLCSESRIITYFALSQNTLPPESWYYQKRTLSAEFEQEQKPIGKWKSYNNINYFEGYYTYCGKKIFPSWGGSLFEYLMPSLLVNERIIAPLGIGKNNQTAIEIHIDYALNTLKYPIWGLSPSSTPDGKYGEFGVPSIGTKKGGYTSEIISPYASILAISYNPEAVIKNLKNMISLYPVYGEYGFYDNIDPMNNSVGYTYLALDQAMILISLTNYLQENVIANRFMSLPNMNTMLDLISKETQFED